MRAAMGHGTLARLPDGPPLLQVVVDTEEEFDWGRPFDRDSVAVTAMQAQGLAQAVFDEFGVQPTYVIDHPVAAAPEAAGVLRAFRDEGRCQIGAHLHPWVNPPFAEEVSTFNSYPGNLPPELERDKLTVLTQAIGDAFGVPPTMYKAGRYGVGPGTAATLAALGYQIDLSVVPHTDFGDDGGPDFRGAPDRPYWVGAPGRLLEIPLARGFAGALAGRGAALYPAVVSGLGRKARLGGVLSRLGLLERATLTPEGVDLPANLRLLDAMLRQGHRVLTMTYHSPSLAVGHTPYVRSGAELKAFLATIRGVLEAFFGRHGGQATTAPEIRRMALASL